MSKFCEIVFCVPLLFRRHVCLSNLKHTPSRELPLTARKTVFSHLKSWKLLSQVLSLISTFPRNLILVLFLKRSRKLWALLQKLPKIYLPFAKAHSATYIKSPLTSKYRPIIQQTTSLTYIALILFLLLHLCIPITIIFCLVAFVTSF